MKKNLAMLALAFFVGITSLSSVVKREDLFPKITEDQIIGFQEYAGNIIGIEIDTDGDGYGDLRYFHTFRTEQGFKTILDFPFKIYRDDNKNMNYDVKWLDGSPEQYNIPFDISQQDYDERKYMLE